MTRKVVQSFYFLQSLYNESVLKEELRNHNGRENVPELCSLSVLTPALCAGEVKQLGESEKVTKLSLIAVYEFFSSCGSKRAGQKGHIMMCLPSSLCPDPNIIS